MKTNTRAERKRRSEKLRKYAHPGSLTAKVERVLDLPHGALNNAVHIELTGNYHAVIDGKCEILAYDDDMIKLGTGSGTVRFTGQNLMMSCLTVETAVVEGHLLSIEFL